MGIPLHVLPVLYLLMVTAKDCCRSQSKSPPSRRHLKNKAKFTGLLSWCVLLGTHAVLRKTHKMPFSSKQFLSDQGDSCRDSSAIPEEPFSIKSTPVFISVAHKEQDAGFPFCRYRFYGKPAEVTQNPSIAKHLISGAPRSWKSDTAMESVLLDIYKNYCN